MYFRYILLAIIIIIALIMDFRSYRCPNYLIILGLLGGGYLFFDTNYLIGFLIGFLVGFIGFLLHCWGGGDGKLIMIVGLLLGKNELVGFFCYVIMATLVYAVYKVMIIIRRGSFDLVGGFTKKISEVDKLHRLHMVLPIACGVILSIVKGVSK